MRRVVVCTLALCSLLWVQKGVGKEQSQSLNLSMVIEKTLSNHPSVQAAKSRLGASESRVSQSWSNLFPNISLQASLGTFHDRTPNPGEDVIPLVGRDRNRYVGKLVVKQPVFHGFALWEGIKQSETQMKVAKNALDSAISQALQETLSLYFEIQVKQRELASRKEAKVSLVNQLKQTETRFAQGRSTKLQLLQSRFAATAEDPKIEELNGVLEQKLFKLSQRLNINELDKYEFTDSLSQAMKVLDESALPPLAEAVEILSGNNPKIKQASLQMLIEESQLGIDLSDDLPSLDLLLTAGTDSFLRRDIATSDTLFYGAEVMLTVPLFSGLSSVAERSAGRAAIEAERRNAQRVRQDELTRLLMAYQSWKVSSSRIEVAASRMAYTEELLSQMKKRLRAGSVTVTEVLDAQSQYLEAKTLSGDAVIQKINAVTEIRSLLGWFNTGAQKL